MDFSKVYAKLGVPIQLRDQYDWTPSFPIGLLSHSKVQHGLKRLWSLLDALSRLSLDMVGGEVGLPQPGRKCCQE